MEHANEFNEKQKLNARVDELNAIAVAENLADLREEYDMRITALENEITTLKGLVQKQSMVVGMAMQGIMGNGSTVPDPTPGDRR